MDKIKVPLFIAQGSERPALNHAEAEQIVAALKRNGNPVEYMLKMDEGATASRTPKTASNSTRRWKPSWLII